jgi:hypothetical protein
MHRLMMSFLAAIGAGSGQWSLIRSAILREWLLVSCSHSPQDQWPMLRSETSKGGFPFPIKLNRFN